MRGKRNGWKRGDWLIIDEESGVTRYASEVSEDYYGNYVTERYGDGPHPQDFIRPLRDPEAVPYSNPPDRNFIVNNSASHVVGNTNVKAARSPFAHIYGN